MERTTEVAASNLGPSHLQVAVSLNNMAMVHIAQGRYAEAEPL